MIPGLAGVISPSQRRSQYQPRNRTNHPMPGRTSNGMPLRKARQRKQRVKAAKCRLRCEGTLSSHHLSIRLESSEAASDVRRET